jgi:pantoate--beta-alanine ligase
MQMISRRLATKGKKIGLVPTMGFLHEGHLSLIRRARKLSDVVITTIFVNPTQFAPHEDFSKYPRDGRGDIKKIKQAGGNVIFIPEVADMYGDNYQTYVNVEEITKTLEGRFRPTHFRGVTTIVAKLFNITYPDIAVFGLKDYQQAMVIKKMASDLDYPVKIIVAPTVRERDGLAMSSRNKYFNQQQRAEAVCLYRALTKAREMVRKEGIKDTGKLSRAMKKTILKTCRTAEIDYISFTDFESLRPVKKAGRKTVCSLAVRLYGVRLIDNMKLL